MKTGVELKAARISMLAESKRGPEERECVRLRLRMIGLVAEQRV